MGIVVLDVGLMATRPMVASPDENGDALGDLVFFQRYFTAP